MPRALQRIEQISLFGRYELLGEPCRNCGLGCTCTPSTASSLGKVNLAWFRVSSGVCLELNSCACQKQYLGMRQQPAQVLLFISWDMQGGTEHFSFLCCFTTHTLLGMVKRGTRPAVRWLVWNPGQVPDSPLSLDLAWSSSGLRAALAKRPCCKIV